MTPSIIILKALLAVSSMVLLAGLTVLLFRTRGRVGRWWRFQRGESRNRRVRP